MCGGVGSCARRPQCSANPRQQHLTSDLGRAPLEQVAPALPPAVAMAAGSTNMASLPPTHATAAAGWGAW
eukprot:316945-Prorocentrum_lima.AAC.1